MEEDYKPDVQSQRQVNPKIHVIIKKEVIKILDAGMIYPISDSPWVSHIHCVPKKGGITVVENENNELIPTRMPFGLCNAPGTFQRCMMEIFHDMIEKTMEVFMDDFLVFGDSFASCLSHLDTMLQRLEVDRAKVDVIAMLPHPTTVKGVRSFFGHADFYRRFIQDFSKIARPMTHLLEKETTFVFSKDCIDAFETLKKKLTEAPILVVPDWNLPFELMCDASDFAIGAVLGQRPMRFRESARWDKGQRHMGLLRVRCRNCLGEVRCMGRLWGRGWVNSVSGREKELKVVRQGCGFGTWAVLVLGVL
uniref:Reverse transcriptase domain-containing protein n=1 Tax=Tanacetum cinerariifolium TaxID=118510 RepID=A0A6L2LVD1_TANCI|nr:reverse transcriptase domain-containing protein [Tanacetum cinerariifolium]